MELLKELNRLNNLKYGMVAFNKYNAIPYCLMTTIDDLKEGDLLVVRTKNGFEVAYFYEYTDYKNDKEKATNWIVQKIDTREYEANKKAYEERKNT